MVNSDHGPAAALAGSGDAAPPPPAATLGGKDVAQVDQEG
jgi:hypothetical protein